MTDFLVTYFIRDSGAVQLPAVREQYGVLSGVVGVILNLLLCLGKLFAGLVTGSIAITADALNNLTDAGASVVTLVGFRLAGQKADDEHPFGHGRMEYLSGLMVSLIILLVGFELGKQSLEKILRPEAPLFSVASMVILGVSILVKLWMYTFNRKLSRRIGSAAMAATAADSLSDAAATAAVLAGALVGHFAGVTVDGWVGLLVAVFILRAGWGAAKETLNPLLGQSPDPALVRAIHDTVLAHPQVVGIHDLMIHDYGPGRAMMSFHAEVPMGADLMAVHDEIDAIERELKEKFHIHTSIHMDPIATDDVHVRALCDRVAALVQTVDPAMTIHDFRMTDGPQHTNLIFDVCAPHACPMSDEAIRSAVCGAVRAMDGGTYFAVVEVDRSFSCL